MPDILPDALVLTDYTVVIDEDNYEAAVGACTLTPSSSTINYQGGTPDSRYTAQTRATWVASIEFVQDPDDEASLGAYLFDHEGETKVMTFVPRLTGATYTATVRIVPGAIGGKVNTFGVTTVSLGIVGKPVRTPPVAG